MKNKLDKHIKELLSTPQTPPANAWANIQMALPPEKRSKKILPLWLYLSGIVATMLMMLGLGYFIGLNVGSNSILQNNLGVPNSISYTNSNNSIDEINSTSDFNNNSQNNNAYASNSTFANEEFNNRLYAQQVTYPAIYETNTSGLNFNFVNNESSFSKHNKLETESSNSSFFENILNTIQQLQIPILEKETNSENSFAIVSTQKKANNEIKKKKIEFDRFHISAFASPLAVNTFVGKSMLNDEFNDLPTQNNVTMAYGFKGAYSVSPKLRVRTGVSMIGFEQITNEVPLAVNITGTYSSAPKYMKNSNINYTGDLRITEVNPTSLPNAEIVNATTLGKLQQQVQYVEIPLEAEYNFVQTNSIGISLTGGASTWLLSKNKLYVQANDLAQELGKADNLNAVSFSANAGLKFDMGLTEKIKINVEPNFKYLINPVNDIERYNPYTVGVNAGITVSFK